MSAPASPPVVRYRSSCPDLATYRDRHKAEYARSGVFVPSERPQARPLGTRVHLKIELADRTLGYSGGAIVVEHVQGGGRLGYLLRLDEVTIEVELEEGPAETPVATPTPRGAAASATSAPSPSPAASATPAPAPTPAPASTSTSAATATATPPPRPAPRPELLDLLFGEAAPAAAPAAPADPFGAPAAAVASSADPFEPAAGAPAAAATSSAAPFIAAAAAAPAPPASPSVEGAPFPAPGPDPLAPVAAESPAPSGAGSHDGAQAAPGPVDRSEVALLQLPHRSLVARLARARVLVPVAAALAVAAVALVVTQRRAAAVEAAFAAALSAADARVRAGRLAAPAGDAALDHLDAARRLLPGDERLTSRGKLLADTFEDLGHRALGRGDLREAAAHFRSALRAEPARASARSQLETIARIEPKRRDAPR